MGLVRTPSKLHPILDPPIAYNIAHDDSLVAIAFQLNACDSLDVGVDVMRVALPKGLSLAGFIDILSDQVCPFTSSFFVSIFKASLLLFYLYCTFCTERTYGHRVVVKKILHPPHASDFFTPTHYVQLSPLELKNLHRTDINPEEASTATLQTLFWLWTVKEAYTKTLGLGLGFNFSRITFDARSDAIYVDDAPLCGFEFVLFGLDLDSSEGVGAGAGRYQGVAVRRIESGSDDVGAENVPSTIVRRSVMFKKQQQQRQQQQDEDWIKFWSAADLVERCDILAT